MVVRVLGTVIASLHARLSLTRDSRYTAPRYVGYGRWGYGVILPLGTVQGITPTIVLWSEAAVEGFIAPESDGPDLAAQLGWCAWVDSDGLEVPCI